MAAKKKIMLVFGDDDTAVSFAVSALCEAVRDFCGPGGATVLLFREPALVGEESLKTLPPGGGVFMGPMSEEMLHGEAFFKLVQRFSFMASRAQRRRGNLLGPFFMAVAARGGRIPECLRASLEAVDAPDTTRLSSWIEAFLSSRRILHLEVSGRASSGGAIHLPWRSSDAPLDLEAATRGIQAWVLLAGQLPIKARSLQLAEKYGRGAFALYFPSPEACYLSRPDAVKETVSRYNMALDHFAPVEDGVLFEVLAYVPLGKMTRTFQRPSLRRSVELYDFSSEVVVVAVIAMGPRDYVLEMTLSWVKEVKEKLAAESTVERQEEAPRKAATDDLLSERIAEENRALAQQRRRGTTPTLFFEAPRPVRSSVPPPENALQKKPTRKGSAKTTKGDVEYLEHLEYLKLQELLSRHPPGRELEETAPMPRSACKILRTRRKLAERRARLEPVTL